MLEFISVTSHAILLRLFLAKYILDQRFSTWGRPTRGGTQGAQGGTQNAKFYWFLFLFCGCAVTKRLRTAVLDEYAKNEDTSTPGQKGQIRTDYSVFTFDKNFTLITI